MHSSKIEAKEVVFLRIKKRSREIDRLVHKFAATHRAFDVSLVFVASLLDS